MSTVKRRWMLRASDGTEEVWDVIKNEENGEVFSTRTNSNRELIGSVHFPTVEEAVDFVETALSIPTMSGKELSLDEEIIFTKEVEERDRYSCVTCEKYEDDHMFEKYPSEVGNCRMTGKDVRWDYNECEHHSNRKKESTE